MLGRSSLLTSARLGGGEEGVTHAHHFRLHVASRPSPSGRAQCHGLLSVRGLMSFRLARLAFRTPRKVAEGDSPLLGVRVAWRESRGTLRSLAAPRPPPPPARARPQDPAVDPGGLRGLVAGAQRFRFWGDLGPGADRVVLEVRVPQVLHPQYGMYAWPCAVVLAQYLWFHRNHLPQKAVLEIGAGVSLPGVLAAKCGAKVILSDSAEQPHCLEMCRRSCQLNNLPQVRVVGLTWGHISQDLLSLPPQDIILASDVFFEPEDFEDILVTVYFLMQKNPKVQLWSTYQVRSADWSLEALLYKWDMKCVHIPLESFEADKEDLAGSSLPGRHTVEMLVIFAKDSL